MKPFVNKVVAIALLLFTAIPISSQTDPCDNETYGNAELRECYAREQARVNAEVERIATGIADHFRKDANEYQGVVGPILRRAASEVSRSQKVWKRYRDQHCTAILDSFTTGSGAETAFEHCEFRLGQARLEELRSAFGYIKTGAK